MLLQAVVGVTMTLAAFVAHEMGHVLFGSCAGFRFRVLGVGPIGIQRVGRRLRLRRLPAAAWGPFASMSPAFVDRMEQRTAWLLAGGPLASASLGIVAISAFYGFGAPRFVLGFGILNVCLFAATGQPFFGTGAGIPSDGQRVWALWRRQPDARAAAALVVLDGQAAAGVRPAEWDEALVRIAAQVAKPPAFALAAAVAKYRHVADRAGLASADAEVAAIQQIYPSVPRWLRGEAAAEAAFWLASVSQDVSAARALIGDARGALTAPHRRWRAESAVLLLSGDVAGADRALEEAERTMSNDLVSPTQLDRTLIASMRTAIESTRP